MKTTFPIISVPFAGGHYMCVKGSHRAYALEAANYAFDQGDRELANILRDEALKLPGCAFESRENADDQS